MLALRIFRIAVALTVLCLWVLLLFRPDLLPRSPFPLVMLIFALGQWLRVRANAENR